MKGQDTRPVVACDIDGVLADSDALVRWLIGDEFGLAVFPEDIDDWNAYERVLEGHVSDPRGWLDRTFADPGFLDAVPLVLPSLAALRRIRGYARSIHVVTSRPEGEETESATRTWLDGYGLPYDRIAFVADKSRYCRDFRISYIIEDAPHHAEACLERGIGVFLVDWPYNRRLAPRGGLWRVENPIEIPDLLIADHERRKDR